MRLKIAVFVSGKGSNLEAIIKAVDAGKLDASIVCVVSNNPAAYGLEVARAHGLTTFALSNKGLSREEHERKIVEHLAAFDIDFVVLAGYMRVLTGTFLNAFKSPGGFFRVINIHPALLPAFKGASGYDDAFNYGVKISGITVHLVDELVDHGPILAQRSFPRLVDDTIETFKARGLAVEHELYPEVLATIAESGINSLLARKPEEVHQ